VGVLRRSRFTAQNTQIADGVAMNELVSDSKLASTLGKWFGFVILGALLAIGLIIQSLDIGLPQFIRLIFLVALCFALIGQSVVSWRRSKGFEVLLLINFALILIIPTRSGIEQLANLQLSMIGLIIYMYPSILLYRRNHKRKFLYAMVNFFLGVYVVPWIILLRIGLKLPRLSNKKFH
jgi:hypothetical protein